MDLPLRALVRRSPDYRRVLATTPTMQVVTMTLLPGETIPPERHSDATQLLWLEEGVLDVWMEGSRSRLHPGHAAVIRPGLLHEVRQVGLTPARLVTAYAFPPGRPLHPSTERNRRQPAE